MTRLIIGCGYLGTRVAQRWRDAGQEVALLTRSAATAQRWRDEGYAAVIGDVTQPGTLNQLPPAETVLYAVGFDRRAGLPMRDVYVGGLRNVLNALPNSTGRLIYISSTGVYGSADGGWVDEATPCVPLRENGRVCLEAERVLQQHPLGNKAVILRLAGIYGPQRIPSQDKLKAGEPIDAPAEGYLNLIHVDDAASVVLAAEKFPQPAGLYLVADGQPAVRGEYYAELARLLKAPPPRFVPPPVDSPAAARAAADKRIDSRKMFAELKVRLQYPDYRAGLAAIVGAD
ncbi:MAG: SDR family oxidoreductase [Pirellulales bacterium]